MHYTELPEKILVNGCTGQLHNPGGRYYYFFWGNHSPSVRLMRSRLPCIYEVMTLLGISHLNVEGLAQNGAFPEFINKEDMLKFLNYAYNMGAIETGDQDDFERRRLGLAKKHETT